MISRRVLLGTGAVVAGTGGLLTVAQLTHRLDDVADAIGVEPKALPDADDTAIVRRAARDCARLLAAVEATAATHAALPLAPIAAIVREQLAAVGGSAVVAASPVPAEPAKAAAALATTLDAAAGRRSTDAVRAGSPALVRVLASMAAGHAQSARAVGRMA